MGGNPLADGALCSGSGWGGLLTAPGPPGLPRQSSVEGPVAKLVGRCRKLINKDLLLVPSVFVAYFLFLHNSRYPRGFILSDLL